MPKHVGEGGEAIPVVTMCHGDVAKRGSNWVLNLGLCECWILAHTRKSVAAVAHGTLEELKLH